MMVRGVFGKKRVHCIKNGNIFSKNDLGIFFGFQIKCRKNAEKRKWRFIVVYVISDAVSAVIMTHIWPHVNMDGNKMETKWKPKKCRKLYREGRRRFPSPIFLYFWTRGKTPPRGKPPRRTLRGEGGGNGRSGNVGIVGRSIRVEAGYGNIERGVGI
jgi:hypothetical protein